MQEQYIFWQAHRSVFIYIKPKENEEVLNTGKMKNE